MPSIIYCAGDESISHFCANLDLHLVREKRTDEAFWANLAGAEWCMHLAAGSFVLPKLLHYIILYCHLITCIPCACSRIERLKAINRPSRLVVVPIRAYIRLFASCRRAKALPQPAS